MNKEELKNIFQFLENSEYSFDQDIINNHCTDWRGDFIGTSDIILFPKSTNSISKIILVMQLLCLVCFCYYCTNDAN